MRDGADRRFTRKELMLTSGLSFATISYRVKKLGIRSTSDGYTYEDIKRIMQYRPARKTARRPREEKMALLKKMLANDGMI